MPSVEQKIGSEADVELFDVHNRKLFTLGKISLPIKYGNDLLEQEFIVTSGISEACILGLDAALKHEFVLDGRTKTIFLSRDEYESDSLHPRDMVLTSIARVIMLPSSAQVVLTKMKGYVGTVPQTKFIFTPANNLPEGIRIDCFANEISSNGIYNVVIENSSHKPIILPRALTLGSVEFSYNIIGKIDVTDCHYVANETQPADKSQQLDVEPQFKEPLTALLNNYDDLFASNDAQLGSTGLIKHSIDTQGCGPIRLRPYRAARGQKDEMERQIKEMMDTDVIRPSTSPWAAPVILVEKKNGEQRFCVDYRKLNSLTKKDSFPLPRIDDTLDRLHGKKFFTTLDLASGYWQIELDESSKEKTAFIVENNLYEFNRMAFGLCNAPATFQRLMNFVLRDVLGKKALVYLDDVIIFSETFEDHLNDIREVFDLIRNAGLKLKRKKCQFIKESVNYLGHIISSTGIAPDPDKIDKIANYKTPESVDEVRSFLGLAGYYRRFIKNFGSIAQSLTAKTHKEASKLPFTWTDTDQKAFETLRTCLTTPPILAYPDFDQEFLLFTDACDYGVGAVLSQIQNGNEVVIAYASKQLKKAELKYATVEKEAWAVVSAIKHFRHYLLDKPFTVISDHRPLQWLEEQKDNNGRLGRWAILLASVNYKIKYRPGRIHQNADCLSRLKVAMIQLGDVYIEDDPLDPPERQNEIIIKQSTDALCKEIIDYLQTGELSPENTKTMPIWAKEIEFYQVIKGVLFRFEPSTKTSKRNMIAYQVVLPLSLRPRVLREMHDAPLAGHLAYLRTYLKIKAHYYWPTMRTDIKEYCATCATCIANTPSRLRAQLHPHELAKAPFQVVGMDFLGPIRPASPNGNKFVMVMTDYFSKWVEAIALPDQTAATTVDCLFKNIVLRHGPPKVIISDRGTNFTSKLFRSFCATLNIEQRLTTAYNPASNGETERFNRTLTTMLRKELEDGAHSNWEEMLGNVCFAYRASIHSSTLESPYYLLHGRDPNVAINHFLSVTPQPIPSASDYIGSMVDRLHFSFHRVREENAKARERQRKQYNARAVVHKYAVGDKVLLSVKVVDKGDNRKFTSKFRGPYRIIKVFNNCTVDIADNSFEEKRVHVNRLKPLFESMLWKDEVCPEIEKDKTTDCDQQPISANDHGNEPPIDSGNAQTQTVEEDQIIPPFLFDTEDFPPDYPESTPATQTLPHTDYLSTTELPIDSPAITRQDKQRQNRRPFRQIREPKRLITEC